MDGGQGGIRTHGGLAPSPVFKTGAFNRSATCPRFVRATVNVRRCHAWKSRVESDIASGQISGTKTGRFG